MISFMRQNNINLHLLLATGHLEPFVKDIKREFSTARDKIIKKIPVRDIDVVIYDNPEGVIPELGIGGYSPNGYLVLVSLDLKDPQFSKVLEMQLLRILTHELHHCLRWQKLGYGETLLEALISEGLADHFDMEINNQPPQLWDKALTSDQEKKLLRRAKREFNDKNYSHQDWFFGCPKRKIPRWTGYTLGFNLVGSYLKRHEDKKPSRLYKTKASEFLK